VTEKMELWQTRGPAW